VLGAAARREEDDVVAVSTEGDAIRRVRRLDADDEIRKPGTCSTPGSNVRSAMAAQLASTNTASTPTNHRRSARRRMVGSIRGIALTLWDGLPARY
jgi:hypothetical protein